MLLSNVKIVTRAIFFRGADTGKTTCDVYVNNKLYVSAISRRLAEKFFGASS